MVYIVAGLVSVFVIIYASVALVQSYENKGVEDGAESSASQLHSSPVATSETALKSGRVSKCAFLLGLLYSSPRCEYTYFLIQI